MMNADSDRSCLRMYSQSTHQFPSTDSAPLFMLSFTIPNKMPITLMTIPEKIAKGQD